MAVIELPFRKVIVVGAGFSGITFGCQLKSKLRFDEFVIYDRQGDIGDVWFANQCSFPTQVPLNILGSLISLPNIIR